MFQTIVVACYGLSFIATTYFLLTWTPAILVARRRGFRVSWWEIVDFGIFQLAIWMLSCLTLWRAWKGDLPQVDDWTAYFSRLLVLGVATVGSAIRAGRWIKAQVSVPDSVAGAVEAMHRPDDHRLLEDSPES